jgi:hypothetical protein
MRADTFQASTTALYSSGKRGRSNARAVSRSEAASRNARRHQQGRSLARQAAIGRQWWCSFTHATTSARTGSPALRSTKWRMPATVKCRGTVRRHRAACGDQPSGRQFTTSVNVPPGDPDRASAAAAEQGQSRHLGMCLRMGLVRVIRPPEEGRGTGRARPSSKPLERGKLLWMSLR